MDWNLDYNEIGRNIRYYRQNAHLKQNQLADLIDVSPQHISHIESGVPLSLLTLVKIANALGVDANRLLGSNLSRVSSVGLRGTLRERIEKLSEADAEKVIQICDLFLPQPNEREEKRRTEYEPGGGNGVV